MKAFERKNPLPLLFLALGQVMGGVTLAGQPAGTEPPARPAALTAAPYPGRPHISMKSPVAYFRELLAMSPAERSQALTNRTPENRRLILAKVREYSLLKPGERELRLAATELEWRLVPLMRLPATNRTAQLAALSEGDRKMIEPRLQEWDRLSDNVRNDLLARRESIRVFIQVSSVVTNHGPAIVSKALVNASQRHAAVQEGVKKLQAMSEEERQRTIVQFNQFFKLSPQEEQKVLHTLTVARREQMSKTLSKYRELTHQQRAQCIRSSEQFANMSPAEQQQFLKNAERWLMMTPEERQTWREVVEKVSNRSPGN